jgi:5-methylcytosine-specific restriction endonuclease McrA
MATHELTPNRRYGKVCEKHPEFNGLRRRSVCVQCSEDWHANYRKTPKGMEAANRKNRAAYARAPEKSLARFVRRRSDKEDRVPTWANLEAIKEIYRVARESGMVVDHIIPLRGRLVSGLHVEGNLQLLSQKENDKKGNKYAIE